MVWRNGREECWHCGGADHDTAGHQHEPEPTQPEVPAPELRCSCGAHPPAYPHEFCWTCGAHFKHEPQEGASLGANRSADSQDSAGVSTRKDEARGVPSCDSELAAIRQKIKDESVYEDGGYLSLIEGRVLLRMVDELTERARLLDADRAKLGAKNDRIKNNWRETERERDDLRAKLAEAHADVAQALADRRMIAEKLAEAEKRAEAAEAVAEERRDRAKKAELALACAKAWRY